MRLPRPCRPGRPRRPGKILVLLALLLPALLGVVGLTLDGGLLLGSYRQAQNAADAAATAAAVDLLHGQSVATATATATTYVQQYNGLAGASVAVHSPPSTGKYAGSANYVEAVVTYPVKTLFVQVLGVNANQQVQARAVAGYEPVAAGEGVAVLDPSARPGLSVSGGGTLKVNGRVVINSQGAGLDANGNPVNLGMQQYAATTGNGSTVQGMNIDVVGGVDTPANYQNLPGNTGSPLHAGSLPEPDPLKSLPTPTATGYGDVSPRPSGWTPGQPLSLNGGTTTLNPGVYDSIKITNSATVTFNPGIYILMPTGAHALTINGSAPVTGNGIMFYNTGGPPVSNFNGSPDSSDGEQTPPTSGLPNFGDVTINGQKVTLSGLSNPTSPFNGMLFYQRRWNTTAISIQGNGSNTTLGGTLYAKWAQFKLAGSSTYNAQFIAGSIAVSGQANVTLNYAGKNLGKANQVFLVE